ncbi:hypothetical protein C0J52_02478 [Blattella germanica]|nr:hypothetical protein C0J52_02478 [Blattella germanica]
MVRLTLSEDTQKALQCLIGHQVSSESPWTNVKKEALITHLAKYQNHSEIFQFKDSITLVIQTVAGITGIHKAAEFQNRDPEFARDGYVCFEPNKEKYDTVAKMRVDVAIQATPEMDTSIAQTVPPLPSNVWTQYEYHVDSQREVSGDLASQMLILGCPHEVYSLQFCPVNENILVGGCINGQILVWDIAGKLKSVGNEPKLSPKELKYHLALINYLGRYQDLKPDGVCSLQFVSCSKDGYLLIWDLQSSSRVKFGGKKLKQSRKFPAFKPLYKLVAENPVSGGCIPLTTVTVEPFPQNYALHEPVSSKRKFSLTQRFTYKPELQKPKSHPEMKMYLGSLEGEIIEAKWEGYEFNPGDAVNIENGNFEVWDFLERSDKPSMIQNITGGMLTGIYPSKLGENQNVIGVADNSGIFHVFFVPHEHMKDSQKCKKSVTSFFNHEMECQRFFEECQNRWLESNAETLAAQKEAVKAELKLREMEKRVRERTEREKKKKEEEKLGKQKLDRTKDFLKEDIASIKWNTEQELLLTNEQPEAAAKVMEEHKEVNTIVENYFEEFKEKEDTLLNYMKENPYEYNIRWKQLLAEGMQRCQIVNTALQSDLSRLERYFHTTYDHKELSRRKYDIKGKEKKNEIGNKSSINILDEQEKSKFRKSAKRY